MEKTEILMCGNRGVLDGMILTALSLSRYSSLSVRLHIGTMTLTELDPAYVGITDSDRELIEQILKRGNENSEVRLIDMTEGFCRHLLGGKNTATRYTPYAMLRLLADLYDLPTRIIYLDTDVLLSGDIAELWRVGLDGALMGGVLDDYGRFFIGPRYMNSGVMLWDLEGMRRSGALAACRDLCYRKKMLLCDQSALNKCVKKRKLLPRRFNEQKASRKDTLVRHFSMRIKFFPRLKTVSVKPWDDCVFDKLHTEEHFRPVVEEWKRIKAEGYRIG